MPSKQFSASIVIPNYNGRKLLQKHLPAVVKNSKTAEIFVVDDASTDDSVSFLKREYPDIKVVEHQTNRRFAAACNSGVEAANGNIVILLNNDVSPQKDYLKPLMKTFKDPWVFAVGCKELDKNGVESGRAGMKFERGLAVHYKCKDQNGNTTAWAAGGSAAFRKSMWEKLGGMDTLFKPAYEEDRDISYRALKRGWTIAFAPNSLVYHQHETTNTSALGATKMKLASYKNHLLFVWKNIHDSSLLSKHLIWLPYHLLITTIKSRGLFLPAFFWALSQLPTTLKKRAQEVKENTRKDADVFEKAAC